jgi:ATP-dependent RNA helicase MSS116, mitochondrial
LVIAPTRELAVQIAEQATALVTYQHGWTVQAVYGGCSIQRDRAVLNQRVPAILVATPGRLLDLLKGKTRVKGNVLFADCLGETNVVVLDEADRLLQAFPTEITTILSYLPRVEKRQTMLFSATIPVKLKGLLSREGNSFLPTDYVRLDCVRDDDVSTQTNVRVEQSYVQLSDMKTYLTSLLSIVDEAMKEDAEQFKIVIFFPTAKLVKFVAKALGTMKLPVLSIHSRMGQGARNRASSQFRQTKPSILLTSDVSARGVDYPDVSLVVQVRLRLETPC